MKAAVAGATGGVGKAIVERLVRDGVATRALVRDPYTAVRPTQSLLQFHYDSMDTSAGLHGHALVGQPMLWWCHNSLQFLRQQGIS